MGEQFNYYMPVKLEFGAGVSKEVRKYIKGDSVLIISDPFLYNNGVAKAIGESLTGKRVHYFFEIEPNPTCASVDMALEKARAASADCVIGLGGGSALDVSKIVACLTTSEGSIYDYYAGGTRTFDKRKTMLICIPTTAGTGSEVTNVGVYTDEKKGVKMPMLNEGFWADYAIIDYELTYTLPDKVTAATGLDAFCHAIEAYWNKASIPICDMLALRALRLIVDNIEVAYREPENAEARSNMMEASVLAGIAFSQTRTTGIHALSFPLTTEFHASHGVACSVTLPAFIKASAEQAEEKMERLARYLGYASIEKLSRGIERLMEGLGLPTRLGQIGVKESDLEHITRVGLKPAIIQLTPATMNEETVYQLLKSIL